MIAAREIMNTMCRICGEKKEKLVPIFENDVYTQIIKCLPIEISNSDGLPDKMCDLCVQKINICYELHESCINTDQNLKTLLKDLISQEEVNLQIKEYDNSTECFKSFQRMEFESQGTESKLAPSLVIDCLVNDNVFFIREADGTEGDLEDSVKPSFSKSHEDELQFNSTINLGQNCSIQFICDDISHNKLSYSVMDFLQKDKLQENNVTEANSDDKDTEPQTSESHSSKHGKTLKEAFSCCECIQDFQSKAALRKHLQSKHNQTRVNKCRFCSRELSTWASLSIHEATHSQDKPLLCDLCGKSFKHANNLRVHARTHAGIRKKYTCKICSKSYMTNFFLKEHMNIHTGATPYKCEDCGREFRERIHLRQHKRTHSLDKFTCSVCGSQFNRKGNMAAHIKKYHLSSKEKPATEASSLVKAAPARQTELTDAVCPICPFHSDNQVLFKAHLKSHSIEQGHFCNICGKMFRYKGSLTYHRRSAHTGERPYKCSFCNEHFPLRSVQLIHERRRHTGERPYKCPQCPSFFATSSSFKNHAFVHLKEKMFECQECGKRFARNGALLIHKKLHLGDRRYTCDQCGKSYVQKHDMLKHRKTHDPKRTPFFCKFCGNSFALKKDFAKHAFCQLNLTRKSDLLETSSAEKILDSVRSEFERSSKDLLEEEAALILDSVQQFSNERLETSTS